MYLTVSAHFYPGLVVQLDSGSNFQVGYLTISTGLPLLKHNHRQEGIPPSWSADLSMCADRLQVATECDHKKHSLGGSGGVLFLVSAHVIASVRCRASALMNLLM